MPLKQPQMPTHLTPESSLATQAPTYKDGLLVEMQGMAKGKSEETDKETQPDAYNRQINAILESITDGFFAVDKIFTVTYWNHTAELLSGIKKETIIGKNIWGFYPSRHTDKYFIEFSNAMATGFSRSFEDYFAPISRWLSTSIYPAENGLSVYFKDITEQKRLEMFFVLEKEVLRLNVQPKVSMDDIIDHTLQGIEKIHPSMLCSTMQLIDGKLQNWCGPSLPIAYTSHLKDIPVALNEGSCGTAAYLKKPVIIADITTDPRWQKYRPLAMANGLQACWSFPLIDSNDTVLGTFGIYYQNPKEPTASEINTMERARNLLVTIIEHKRAANELSISNERNNILVKATNDTVWDWDIVNDKIYWNENLKKIFGFDKKSTKQVTDAAWWKNNIHEDDRKRVIEKIYQHIERGKKNWCDTYRFRCADGSYKHVYDRGFLLLDKTHNNPLRMIGAMQDITAQKEYELQLAKLNKALEMRAAELADTNAELERFAYVASHDLQEPLRMVSSFLQLLQKKYYDKIDSTANNYIHYAVDGAERMKMLIADMLQYSRVNTNKSPLETVDMDAVLKEAVLFYTNKIRMGNATVTTAAPLPKITAVKGQMLQLVQNLLSNALKYKREAPTEIHISFVENEQEWEFAVADNGIGIEERYIHKIFIIFQRLHNKTEYSGTGIGLAICKKIIDKHKGKIWAISTPGQGSTFYFTIRKDII